MIGNIFDFELGMNEDDENEDKVRNHAKMSIENDFDCVDVDS